MRVYHVKITYTGADPILFWLVLREYDALITALQRANQPSHFFGEDKEGNTFVLSLTNLLALETLNVLDLDDEEK
jgi:hypothetical protein